MGLRWINRASPGKFGPLATLVFELQAWASDRSSERYDS